MQDYDRRSVLGLIASTGVTALAGCSALGGGSSFSYADWMPERDRDYPVFTADVTTFLDADVSSAARDRLGGKFFAMPDEVLDIEDVGGFANANGQARACTYTVDRAEIAETLEAAEESQRGVPDAPEGYDGFSTQESLYWLGDDYLIATSYAAEPGLLQSVYDTNQGDATAYADTDVMSGLSDQLDGDDIQFFFPGDWSEVQGSTGLGYGWSIQSETADLEIVADFEDEQAASDGDLSSVTERKVFSDYDDLKTTVDGTFVVASGSVSLSDFDMLGFD